MGPICRASYTGQNDEMQCALQAFLVNIKQYQYYISRFIALTSHHTDFPLKSEITVNVMICVQQGGEVPIGWSELSIKGTLKAPDICPHGTPVEGRPL
jgi:hypothetical protein